MSNAICRKCHEGSYEWAEPPKWPSENRKMKCDHCGFVDTMEDFYENYKYPKVDYEGKRYILSPSLAEMNQCNGCTFLGKGYPCPASFGADDSPFKECMQRPNVMWKETK